MEIPAPPFGGHDSEPRKSEGTSILDDESKDLRAVVALGQNRFKCKENRWLMVSPGEMTSSSEALTIDAARAMS